MAELDPNQVEPLISGLESADAFERLRAFEELSDLTRLTFGFRFNAPVAERAASIERWRTWLKEFKRKREREAQLRATVHLSGGDLQLDWHEDDNRVYMTGPATEVFQGTWPND